MTLVIPYFNVFSCLLATQYVEIFFHFYMKLCKFKGSVLGSREFVRFLGFGIQGCLSVRSIFLYAYKVQSSAAFKVQWGVEEIG